MLCQVSQFSHYGQCRCGECRGAFLAAINAKTLNYFIDATQSNMFDEKVLAKKNILIFLFFSTSYA
jgi:hypothetical protein